MNKNGFLARRYWGWFYGDTGRLGHKKLRRPAECQHIWWSQSSRGKARKCR